MKQLIKNTVWLIRKKIFGNPSATAKDSIKYIRKKIPLNACTILDVGCGKLNDGNPRSEDILLTLFNDKKFQVTGIDGFSENIEWRKKIGPKGDYKLMDVRDIGKLNQKFDIVIAHHIIEHLQKDESMKLLETLEKMCTQLLIIGTPIGFVNTEYNVELHQNPLELHRCGWLPKEFEDRGYETIKIKNAFLAFKIPS